MSFRRTDILWDDGVLVHACEGDRAVDSNPDTFLVWTICERDVPASRGHVGSHADANCVMCIQALLAREVAA